MNEKETRQLQRDLNHFTSTHLKGVAPLIVDGDKGNATDKRVRQAKFWLGYPVPANADASKRAFRDRVLHPRNPDYFPKDGKRFHRGRKRRRHQRWRYRQQLLYSYVAPGVVRFDGVPVAKVALPHLKFARAHGWGGRLVSGWRSPSYSQSLCYGMCGEPSCPGLCAGLSSNHVGKTKDRFALDVSDYIEFGQIMGRPDAPDPRIFNDLPRDLVHYSPNGH